jgi:hypothetical protein
MQAQHRQSRVRPCVDVDRRGSVVATHPSRLVDRGREHARSVVRRRKSGGRRGG